MSIHPPPEERQGSELPALNGLLVQWMAVQALQDRYARLADGGADIDARVELASLFIDLPVSALTCPGVGPEREQWAMPLLVGGGASQQIDDDGVDSREPGGRRRRWLLVGGPGSGKSTLTTMVAQQLRLPWIERQVGALPPDVLEAWERARDGLALLASRGTWSVGAGALPLRVNLPLLARRMASHGDGERLSLWDYLAARMVEDLGSNGISADVSAAEIRALVEKAISDCLGPRRSRRSALFGGPPPPDRGRACHGVRRRAERRWRDRLHTSAGV
jgi:hypothetical protein